MAEDVKLDQFEVRDPDDNFNYRVMIEACETLGNYGKPGIRISYTVPGLSSAAVFEPHLGKRWHAQAVKDGVTELLIKERSWMQYDDAWLKNYLVLGGDKLKVRVELKVKGNNEPEIREYDLPFSF
jgi:hypothetical protein